MKLLGALELTVPELYMYKQFCTQIRKSMKRNLVLILCAIASFSVEASQLYIKEMTAVRPACINPTSFTMTFTAAGGTGGPYTYTLTTTGTVISPHPYIQIGSPSTTFSNIPALSGTFGHITLTDGISTPLTFTFGPPLNDGSVTSFDVLVNPPSCNAPLGSVTISYERLTAQPGSTSTISLTGPISYSQTFSTLTVNHTVNNLPVGDYEIRIDDTGCGVEAAVLVYDFVVPPASTPILFTNVVATNPACFAETGSVTFNLAGGTAPYASVCATPTVGTPICLTNVSTGSQTINGLPVGSYTINVTDTNGCPAQSLPFTISQPSPIAFTASSTPTSCVLYDGTITVSVTEGSGSYSAVATSAGSTYTFPAFVSGSSTLIRLQAGTYTVVVTDTTSGCTATQTVTVAQGCTQVPFCFPGCVR